MMLCTWQRLSRSGGESLPPTILLEAISISQTSVISFRPKKFAENNTVSMRDNEKSFSYFFPTKSIIKWDCICIHISNYKVLKCMRKTPYTKVQSVFQCHQLMVVMVTCLKWIRLRITGKIPSRECTFKNKACPAYDCMLSFVFS